MVETILWDNDGVLVDTEPIYFEASRRVLAKQGYALTVHEFTETALVKGESVFKFLDPVKFGKRDLQTLRKQRNAIYSDLLKENVPKTQGIDQVLQTLQGKYRMGIVTSSLKVHFDIIHDSTGLLPYFDFLLTREDFNKPKPDPEAYLTALTKYTINPDTCIVVEDSKRGVQAALGAGLRCIYFPGAFAKNQSVSGVTASLSSMEDLPDVLNAL